MVRPQRQGERQHRYNRKRSEYKASCFLFDVREADATSELPSLQSKLLKDLVEENHSKFRSQEEGKNYLRNRLGKRGGFLKFLVVVDDIGHPDQLGALSVMDMMNTDSLAIVTTRDERVLVQAGITARYKMKKMDPIHSRQLFCWHAFGHPDPSPGYEDLVDSFVKRCAGLPLSLQVIGGLVFGRNDKQYWKLTLSKVIKTLPGDIKQILRISFDTLDGEEKQIFMDIACFFIGKEKSMAIRIWEGSGWCAEHSLQMLKEKCLVEEETDIDKFTFRMHDHLRDLGREMADELRLPPRIWRPQSLSALELEGFEKILATTKGHSFRCLNSIFDRSIGSQITYFLGNRDDSSETSAALLWLELDLNWHWHKSIPPWIPLQNLQYLKIKRGHLTRLWQRNLLARLNCMIHHQKEKKYDLKELFLSKTASLGGFPESLKMFHNLEHLVLEGSSAYWIEKSESEWRMLNSLKHPVFIERHPEWKGLVIQAWDLSLSLRELANLRILVLRDFTLIGKLALNGIGSESTSFESSINNCMGSLEIIEMYNVKQISKVSVSGQHCPRLKSLHLVSMESLIELNIIGVTTPHFLALKDCKKLLRVSGEFDLAKLVIFDCPKLQALPSLANSRFLERISVDKCWRLQNQVNAPATLKYLHYHGGPELVNSFFSNRKTMPSELTSIIGKAVHGAESTLNATLWSGLSYPDAINKIKINRRGRPEVSLKVTHSLSAIIVCAVLRSSHGDVVRIKLPDGESICCSLDEGEWVWTIVIRDLTVINHAQHYIAESCWIPTLDYPRLDSGVKKGYVCTIGEEGRQLTQLSSMIISRLYKLGGNQRSVSVDTVHDESRDTSDANSLIFSE